MTVKIRGRKKDYIERAAGKEDDNYILTCANLAISEHEEPIKTGEGAVNRDDILATELSEDVIIKAENTERSIKNKNEEKTVGE